MYKTHRILGIAQTAAEFPDAVQSETEYCLSFLFHNPSCGSPLQERLSVLAAPRMVRSTFLFARLRSAGGVYLSGGLKPATETSRILTYPPLIEAGIFPTEIKARILTDPGQKFNLLQKQLSLFNYALTFTSLKSSEFVRRNTTVSE
jgi:hypothetical protein